MILAPTTRRVIRPYDKSSFVHTQRYGLVKGHWANESRVGLWLFNDLGNTVADLSGNGNTGTLTGIAPSWTSGKFGSAVLLPGTNEYVDFTGAPPVSGNFTVIFGFAPASTSDNYYIFDTGGSDRFACISGFQPGYYNVYGGQYPTGTSGDSQIPMSGVGILDIVAWSVQNTTGLKGYVNGVEECDVTITGGTFFLELDWFLGCRANISNFTAGRFDFFLVYNRVLSAGEIAELTHNPFLGIERRTRISYFFIPAAVGGVNYEDLLLGVSVSASVAEIDTQQMLDTSKDVSIAASVSEADTQQMLDINKVVSFAASVSVTDILSGVVNYEDLLLGVSVSASVTEADIQQMVDTEKAVTFAAGVVVADTQQMLDTNKAVSFAASVSETDTQQMVDTDLGVTVVASLNIVDTRQMFDIDLPVSFAASITETDTQQMKDLLKDVSFAAGVYETDTQQMKDLLKAVTFAASCGIETEVYYDASAVVVAMYAFIILRQHTS